MKRILFNGLVVVAIISACALTSCGGGIKGTWVDFEYEEIYEFSGKKYKVSDFDGMEKEEGTYELKEEYKEKGFSRGTIVVKDRYETFEFNYTLDGNELIIDGLKLIKGKKDRCGKGSSTSGVSLAKDACRCMKETDYEKLVKCAEAITRNVEKLSESELKKYYDYITNNCK